MYHTFFTHTHLRAGDIVFGCLCISLVVFLKVYTMYIVCTCTCIHMINTQTLEKDKGKIYKSNPKANTFQRKIAASGGT